MTGEEAYVAFLNSHLTRRTGERLNRLETGHGHAESLFARTIWFPAVGNFDYLHPEYEVRDYGDGRRYLDYAYIRLFLRLAIEVDGFGPHARNADRKKFADDRHRQNHLVADGWEVLRFAFHEIVEHPRLCQQEVLQFLGARLGREGGVSALTCRERDVLRLAARKGRPLTPTEVAGEFAVTRQTARLWLGDMLDKGILRAASGRQRITAYEVQESAYALARML